MLIYINASLYYIISYVYNFLIGNILIYIYYTYTEVHAICMTFITEWIKQLLDKIQI